MTATLCSLCDPSGNAFGDAEDGAIEAGRMACHRDRDDHGAPRPERREEGEPGEHAKCGDDGMAANVGRRRGGRR